MTLVIDNGGYQIKAGYDNFEEPIVISNCTAKVNKSMQYLISEQIYQYSQNSSLLHFIRPFDRGYLNNWQCEIEIWNYLFQLQQFKDIQISDTSLIVTEPLLNLNTLENDYNEVIFEYFGFKEYLRKPAPWFSMYEFCSNNNWNINDLNSCIIVDSGFSFTHVIPFIDQTCRKDAIKRINIGGKLLTNYLKEIVSYRQWNMMDEYLLMNQVKEDLSYISLDFINELKNAKIDNKGIAMVDRKIAKDPYDGYLKKQFVLPDFQTIMKGYVKKDEEMNTNSDDQVLIMETERFTVPELLFHPSDIGIDQAGIAESISQCIQSLNMVEGGLAISKIILTGGNINIPFFQQRLVQELRPFVPDIYPMEVCQPPIKPELYAWYGASRFARNEKDHLHKYMITKQQYLEQGNDYCNEKINHSW